MRLSESAAFIKQEICFSDHHNLGNKDETFQGCQMVFFKTKNPNLGKFAIDNLSIFYEYFVYLKAIGNILWPFGIFFVIWYILWPFGKLFPVLVCCTKKNLATLFLSPLHKYNMKCRSRVVGSFFGIKTLR
jgi:hypothetical protein